MPPRRTPRRRQHKHAAPAPPGPVVDAEPSPPDGTPAKRPFTPQHVFLLLGSALGVLCVFLTPPFQVPDETRHFYRAFQLSELRVFEFVALDNVPTTFHRGALVPKSLAALVDSSDVVATRFRPLSKVTPSKVLKGLRAPLDAGQREYVPVTPYPPAAYLPQALGITLGRLFSGSPLVLFYLGRLFALTAWLTLVFIAVRTAPILKWTYVLLALMPMTLYLAASNSVDSIVIGASFLVSAQLLSWAYDSTKAYIGSTDGLCLLGLALTLALSKPLYLSLLGLLLLVPREKFGSTTRYALTMLTIVGSCLAACGLWWALTQWLTTPGPAIDMGRHAADGSHLTNVAPQKQLAYLLSSPFAALGVLLATISTFHVFYLASFVGVLGWSDTHLPPWVPYAYLVALVAASLLGPTVRVRWTAKCLVVTVFLLTGVASLFVLYVYWSSVGMQVVFGYHGRYLIPVAPILFVAFHNHTLRWRRPNALAVAVAVAAFVVTTAWVAGDRLIHRFYVAETPTYVLERVVASPVGDRVVLTVTGWAIDRASDDAAVGVDVELDGRYYRARYGLDRPDVAEHLKKPSYRHSGFEAIISVPQPGRHNIRLRILGRGDTTYFVPDQRVLLLLK